MKKIGIFFLKNYIGPDKKAEVFQRSAHFFIDPSFFRHSDKFFNIRQFRICIYTRHFICN